MTSRRVLTELDEWPRHQTIDTFDSVANASAGWSDGYWFCFGDPDGEVHLITAIRLYHNTNVMDAYAIASTADGKQYNLRASRRLRPRIDDLRVGPLWQHIIRGLRTIRLGCDANDYGIEFDVTWESSAPPYDEAPGVRHFVDGRLVSERSNYIQTALLSGRIKIGGHEWTFDFDDGWVGTRDHSWGMSLGTGFGDRPNPLVAPPSSPPTGGWGGPGMRHWAVVRFPGRSLFYAFTHKTDGTYAASGTGGGSGTVHSRVDYPYDSGTPGWAYTDVTVGEHEWVDGWPRLRRGDVNLTRPDGGVERFRIDVVSKPVHMQGGGYAGGWNDGLGRGAYRGEELIEGEIWDVSHPVKVFDMAGNELRMRMTGSYAELYARYTNLDDPTEVGLGVLEAVIMGEYQGIKGA